MKRVGIICALSSELKNILINMRDKKSVTVNSGEYHIGCIGDNYVVATICSIGKVNAAIRTQSMIDLFDVEIVINTGIAGSVSNKAKHLDIIVGEQLFYHDFDLELFGRFSPYVKTFMSSKDLIDKYLFVNSDREDIKLGNIATGDEFVSSKESKERISNLHNAIACEMEGAAIAHVAYVNKKQFLVLRCISDLADENANKTYDNFEIIAADKVSTTVVNMLNIL